MTTADRSDDDNVPSPTPEELVGRRVAFAFARRDEVEAKERPPSSDWKRTRSSGGPSEPEPWQNANSANGRPAARPVDALGATAALNDAYAGEHGSLGRDDERERLARDIHDLAGQHIVAVLIKVSTLEATCQDQNLLARFAEIRAIITQLSKELHDLVLGERTGIPSGRHLVPALADMVAQWQITVGVRASFVHEVAPGTIINDYVAEAAFRIVQEALTNIASHARTASLAAVRVFANSNTVEIEVDDDGPGIDRPICETEAPDRKHTGIPGMMARAAHLGGHLAIRPREGGGCHLRAVIPNSS